EEFCILLMAGFDVLDNFIHLQVAVPPTELFQRFVRLEPAIAAPTDVIAAEQGPLRARECLDHFAHRRLRPNGFSSRHLTPKNFWISPNTSTKRSISSGVL